MKIHKGSLVTARDGARIVAGDPPPPSPFDLLEVLEPVKDGAAKVARQGQSSPTWRLAVADLTAVG